MTVGEFKKTKMCRNAKYVNYWSTNGLNISNKPTIILDILKVIGTSNYADGSIDVDVEYVE